MVLIRRLGFLVAAAAAVLTAPPSLAGPPDGHAVPALSQPRPLTVERVEVRDLVSQVNGVAYELRIALPNGYGDGQRRFPVVYTLDADYAFLIARNVTDHLSERNHLREVVVVGIAYSGAATGRSDDYRRNRTRDYTPTHAASGGYGPGFQKLSGGGPRFLEVLRSEIIPAVDAVYRTLPGERVLVGHSYGGLFAVWSMLEAPGLFSGYVAVSPSLWYDGHAVFALEEAFARGHDALPGRAYLCVGSREHNDRIDMVADLLRFAAALEEHAYDGLELTALVMPDETHNSVFPGCLSNGLRDVLQGR